MLTTLIPILCPSTQRPFSALKFLVAAETEKLVAKKSESFHLWDRKAVWIDFTWISFTQHDTWCFIGTQQRLDKWMNVWKVGTLILFKPRVAIPLSTDSSEMVYFLQKFLCVMDIEISFTYMSPSKLPLISLDVVDIVIKFEFSNEAEWIGQRHWLEDMRCGEYDCGECGELLPASL